MKFSKGKSGNRGGRKPGVVNETTKLLRRYRGPLIRLLARRALKGDLQAAGLLLNKSVPNPRSVAAPIKLPGASSKNLPAYGRAVLRRMALGKLSPDIARDILASLAAQAQLLEHAEIVARLEELEARFAQSQSLFTSVPGIPLNPRSRATHVQ